MNEIIVTALSSGVLTGLISWIAARRATLADARKSELDNVAQAVAHYREMFDDIAIRHKEAMKDIASLNTRIGSLERRVVELTTENRALLEELKKYKQLNGKVQ